MTSTDFDPATSVLADIAGDYTLDPAHTRLGFSRPARDGRHRARPVHRVHGDRARRHRRPANSKVQVSIVANSVSTGNDQRDDHLRSGDFFESEQYPNMTFVSTDVTRDGDDWTITGDLTIKGVTKRSRCRSSSPARRRTRSATPGSASRAGRRSSAATGGSAPCRARDGRRHGLGQDQARVRRVGHQERLSTTPALTAGVRSATRRGRFAGSGPVCAVARPGCRSELQPAAKD